MNPDQAVVAFAAAVFAIIGLLFLVGWLHGRLDLVRRQRDAEMVDNARLRDLVRQRGGDPPTPIGGGRL